MKLKKATFFLLLLTVLCGCTAQPSNDTNNMLETKTYLYSYDYETEPNGELSTAYHEEKPSVDLNESRNVEKGTVNFKNKNAITYIKMNETFSKGNYECTVTEAYKTISSDFFYTLVDEQYYEALKKEITKRRYISKDTGLLGLCGLGWVFGMLDLHPTVLRLSSAPAVRVSHSAQAKAPLGTNRHNPCRRRAPPSARANAASCRATY